MDPNDRRSRFYARTMHTPDDPHRAGQRASLRELSRALMPLHRTLIEAARNEYAFAKDIEPTPTEMLRLLQEEEFFAWLKPLTALIVDIDDMARRDFSADDFEAIAQRFEALFGEGSTSDFAQRYLPMLQRSIDVAAAHAGLRKLKIEN